MELKVDKTIKILLAAIAFGLFLNASNVFIDKAYANDWDLVVDRTWFYTKLIFYQIHTMFFSILELKMIMKIQILLPEIKYLELEL